MDSKPEREVSIADLFDQFIEASTMQNILSIFHTILDYSNLDPCEFNLFFPKLKRAILSSRMKKNWKAKAIFSKIDKKAAHRRYSNTKNSTPIGYRLNDTQNNSDNFREYLDESASSREFYNNNALQHYNCLIIGGGPAGLRTAIELQLLGATRVVIVEKRGRFSRNNVLHIWPFVIDDLKSLGAKKFYGKFCAGSIDHISIRQLQLILLKICLLIGCDFRDSCSYLSMCPASIKCNSKIFNGNTSDSKQVSPSTYKEEIGSDRPTLDQPLDDSHSKMTSRLDKLDSSENSSSLDSTNECFIRHDTQAGKTMTVKRDENMFGAYAHFQSDNQIQEKELHSCQWDVIIGADGRRNTLSEFFPRKEFRGRLAIAITANFINRQTPAETSVPEISGLSFIYNQDMFNSLAHDTNIQLENICYYKDDTHYFVMTAKKKSLLERGVLIRDYQTTQDLLSSNNVNRQALLKYATDAAYWTTGLEPLDFALNHYGQEDCAMFDFTSMHAASNACMALRTKKGGLTLVGLVGDSLLEPFWPTGSGCARGFLSAFDAAWMCRQWAINKCATIDFHASISSRSDRVRSPNSLNNTREGCPTTYDRMALSVLAERESIYRILAQTKSENLQQNYVHWTLNPHSRYPNLNRHLVSPAQVECLISDHQPFNVKNKLTSTSERTCKVKSPFSPDGTKKPHRKYESLNSSSVAQPNYSKAKSKAIKTSKRNLSLFESRLDIDARIEFEKSYDLDDLPNHFHQDVRQRSQLCISLDEIFNSSISGTLPSSSNLHRLEAKRARDIEECLRRRRQTKLNLVKDQLFERFGGEAEDQNGKQTNLRGAIMSNELFLRMEQSKFGKENRPKDSNGLSLLNSVRRCASFAQRVKNFESQMSNSPQNKIASTTAFPKLPRDKIKNLPHFATVQRVFLHASDWNRDREPKKSKIPIMKLSKDDWNVKCWEKDSIGQGKINSNDLSSSTKSLNSSAQHELLVTDFKPRKREEVFKDRIKDMAGKLDKTRDATERVDSAKSIKQMFEQRILDQVKLPDKPNGRSRTWVSHIKKELIKGSEPMRSQAASKLAPMNPIVPSKPIRKLFEDDKADDDGIDPDKHYDHLCLNQPYNKYLTSRRGYTSHLTRTKYNDASQKELTSFVSANTPAQNQSCLKSNTSRGSSESSTMSDYSTCTESSSSKDTVCKKVIKQKSAEVQTDCFRCKRQIRSYDKITISKLNFHRGCLGCSNCGISLRADEIQQNSNVSDADLSNDYRAFACFICKPSAQNDYVYQGNPEKLINGVAYNVSDLCTRSRAEFLNSRVNFDELYKNIINKDKDDISKSASIEPKAQTICSKSNTQSSKFSTHKTSIEHCSAFSSQKFLASSAEETKHLTCSETPDRSWPQGKEFRIAKSETIDGNEQVTLILPPKSPDDQRISSEDTRSLMINEEELNRMLYLDSAPRSRISVHQGNTEHPISSSSSSGPKSDKDDEDSEGDKHVDLELSEDSSSLDSCQSAEEFDESGELDSTFDVFFTQDQISDSKDYDDDISLTTANYNR